MGVAKAVVYGSYGHPCAHPTLSGRRAASGVRASKFATQSKELEG
jgi:hypothetical protein